MDSKFNLWWLLLNYQTNKSYLHFSFTKQGRFQLHIEVRNDNIQLVDIFTGEGPLTPSPTFTSTQMSTGNAGQGEINLRFRVQCIPNFYGPNCDVRCVPTDQSICDSDGNMVCKEGYQNPENGCLDCVSATGCGK